MRWFSLSISVFLVGVLSASPGVARRQPMHQGTTLTVSVPAELVEPIVHAHTHITLVEAYIPTDGAQQLAHRSLRDGQSFRSDVLAAAVSNASNTVWRLTPKGVPAPQILSSLQACLSSTDEEAAPWPSLVLQTLRASVQLDIEAGDVILRWSRPFGPLLETLVGCALLGEGGKPTGPYVEQAPAVLVANQNGPGGLPLLKGIELRPAGVSSDVVVGSPAQPSAKIEYSFTPDVLLMIQSASAREQDPFRLQEPAGREHFRERLGAELLLAVYWEGKGRPADGLLPPGLAPARPIARHQTISMASPLALLPLSPGAPALRVEYAAEDRLLSGVAERLAVLLRGHGFGTTRTLTNPNTASDGVQLIRWRPVSADPVLALLALAGRHPAMRAALSDDLVADPRLTSADFDERLAGALHLERVWLDGRIVVPLMTAEQWFAIHPNLRGVQIRSDGIILLDDAYWWEAP
jgi:hypothetical protein